MTEEQRQRVVVAARSWLGTPFHHRARIKGVGVDCGQFLIAVFAAADLVAAFDPGPYPADFFLHSHEETYLAGILEHCDPLPPTPEEWLPGDILTYSYGQTRVSHAGIYLGDREIIHAYQRRNTRGQVQIDRTDSLQLASFFSGAWRLKAAA